MWITLIIGLLYLINRLIERDTIVNYTKDFNHHLQSAYLNLENCCNCLNPILEDTVRQDDSLDSLRNSRGGRLEILTISLRWNSPDDLDLHVVDPNRNHIWCKSKALPSGEEILDIDANYTDIVENPIENMAFSNPTLGKYRVFVRYFENRSRQVEIPFTLYIKNGSQEVTYSGIHRIQGSDFEIAPIEYTGN